MKQGVWRVLGIALLAGAGTLRAQVLPKPTINQPTVYTTSGRYRVSIVGLAAAKETVDRDDNRYGQKDEVYVAAAFVLWDRRDGHMISLPNVIRTREYGDIKGQNSPRIQAGTATRTGGVWGGNGGDRVPAGFDPGSAAPVRAMSDQLPLLVFEGGLSDGAEALLVAPSIWESDGQPKSFENYKNNWLTGGVGKLITSPAVQNQVTSSTLTSLTLPGDPALQTFSTIANIFTGGIVGSYLITASTFVTSLVDRPIGLTLYQNADQYQDRVAVVTREKLTSLTPGGGITFAIPFAEPMDGQLNGLYQMFVRVERIQ